MKKNEVFLAWLVLSLLLFPREGRPSAIPEPMVKFKTLKETVTQLLPGAKNLSRRDIVLNSKHLKRLEKYKNWDTDATEFVIYHAKNAGKKIQRTLILFPEHTRQGTLVVAVALDNGGTVTGTVLMEAQQPTMNFLMPLLRAGYMDSFSGKDRTLKLTLAKKYRSTGLSIISRTYALRIANAVKKSAQLFHIYFRKR
ncbi:MAG: hypothetical protein ACE5E9_11505 [Nitrospinaceae bacterium]